jgi:c-di-GMP-binding flagellar brake protein YcgR
MPSEKRRYKRVKDALNIRIKKLATGHRPAALLTVRSINLSATGILFKHSEQLELGQIINLKFLHPGSFDFFEGDARVVRIESSNKKDCYEIGVEFIDLHETDLKKLDYYLSPEEE